jgi:hypothetical protein
VIWVSGQGRQRVSRSGAGQDHRADQQGNASRVLTEVGVDAPSYATVKRRLPIYAQPRWRHSLAAACPQHAGLAPASLVLFDVSILYFETDAGDGFREPGFSKERVRREALVDRVEVKDLHGGSVAAGLRS